MVKPAHLSTRPATTATLKKDLDLRNFVTTSKHTETFDHTLPTWLYKGACHLLYFTLSHFSSALVNGLKHKLTDLGVKP